MKRASFAARDLTVIRKATGGLKPPGTLVRLNSGGPVGIVLALDGNDRVKVKWPFQDEPILLPDACVSIA